MSAKARTLSVSGHDRTGCRSRLSRRDFLRLSGGTALALGIASGLPPWLGRVRAATPHLMSGGPLPLPGQSGLFGLFAPTGPFTLSATPQAGLLPATGGPMLAYTTEQQGRVYHNPVLVLDKGQDFAVRLVNGLGPLGPIADGHGAHASHGGAAGAAPPGPDTIIHWHGVDCPWQQAGHPMYAVGPGGHYDYAFPITNRAGTYWYHPHPHGDTARQAYLGLASFFIVRDEEERAFARELDLTLGTTDIPLVLQDKRIGKDGELVYAPTRDELFMGYLGDRVLVNGAHLPTLSASTRLYRFRLLNGSTARIFNLAFTGGSGAGKAGERVPMTLIANDGGFLAAPRRVEGLFLGPGERAEVLLDLRDMEPGEQVWLRNLPFDPMHNEMEHGSDGAGHGAAGDAHVGAAAPSGAMGGMEMGHDGSMHHGMNRATMPAVTEPLVRPSAQSGQGGQGGHAGHGGAAAASGAHGQSDGLAEGGDYPIFRVSVDRAERYDRKVPERLSAPDEPEPASGGQAAFTRALRLEADGKRWTIAGETFAMDRFPITVPDRRREVWAMENATRSMPHPMHLHGYFLRVRERQGSPAQVRAQAIDGAGRLPTDLGLKDTVLVWPGETVLAAVDFGSPAYPGEQIFLFHCHNLEHEDQGMMVNVRLP
ncbi:multicopper oxidase family protein [Nitratidesulfovibrio liaohensis]|uniref:multicopper oxidase family protein n=1 Tax=Nitratidesulfovibrio liaohensis TaxID=2604158 RepID=UPI001422888C|nr:multicopper oxidase domain-containing protein [Nitratidesulfovibrio liaohensis]NHZ46792.1 multicopper oxidase domain-containing protein [Nitratidesulfovibrio liaohensis]